MTGKDLISGMSYVDSSLINEGEEKAPVRDKKSFPLKRVWVLAACAMIVFGAGLWAAGRPEPQGVSENPEAIKIDMENVFVNDLSQLAERANIYMDPELYDEVIWNSEEITEYFGKDITPPYIPQGLKAAPYNGRAKVYLDKEGEVVVDTAYLSFYHDYYSDGLPLMTEKVSAAKGFTVAASKKGILRDCLYFLPENEIKKTDIGGTAVTIGYRSMSYGPYDPQTHEPSGYYDLYGSMFEVEGIEYEIIFDQMELEEVIKVTASIIYGGGLCLTF